MKITILGCGASYGVPSLLKGFGKCDPSNPKNTRFRCSILIEEQGQNILVDTPPEIRLELLRSKIKKIDALLYTHCHYDHMAGAEDVRNFTYKQGKILDIYGTKHDLNTFKNQMKFVFRKQKNAASITLNPIKMYIPFEVNGISVLPIKQYHGSINSVGYRIGSFAYSTDVKSMDKKGFELLTGIDTWILECTTSKITSGHILLDEALNWIDCIHPKRAYLTHLGDEWDYDELAKKLPKNVKPVYDGMIIKTKC